MSFITIIIIVIIVYCIIKVHLTKMEHIQCANNGHTYTKLYTVKSSEMFAMVKEYIESKLTK